MPARPSLLPDGTIRWIELPVCHCADRRGPAGGVCGNCGNAIPEAEEPQP